jgi:Putative peptidoglycan binding domain
VSDTAITRRDHSLTWKRKTTEDHHFQLQPFKGYVLEVEDVHFHLDSAVFLPDYGDAPDPARITGLAVIAAAYDHAKNNPTRQLLDAGHTDTSGQDAYNLGLSVQRADSVLHVLLGNRSGWVSVSVAKHKVEDYQQIVKWASWAYGWDSDPGAIDNVDGSKTKAGVKGFQRNYNETFGGSLAVDGVVGEQTWGAIFDVYMDYLKKMMKVDDAGLATARGSLKFIGPKRVGCGENFPIEAPRQDNYRSKVNRRVELLFFESGQVPKLDCHPGSACNAILCEVYNPKMYKYTHIPPVPKPPKDPVYDLTNVKSPDHIAPGKEKIKIEYDIVNVGSVITSGKLEIFRKKDNKLLKKFDLTPAQFTEGHHDDFEWDGSVTTVKDEFDDGFVTIEHSPYTAKVTVTGPKGDRTGSTEIKVELKEFKVELAPKDVLKRDLDKDVYGQVGAIPAGALVKLKLKSNIFTITAGDEMGDQTSYTEYEKLWSGGPRVPFYATATVIDSKGNGVVCGKAMGRAKVLWDFTDPKQSLDTYLAVALTAPPAVNQSKGAKPFIDKALNYDKAATKPKDGDNCHLDRGGKRTSASGPPIFQGADDSTQNFPFKVNKGNTRFWGCFAQFEKSGADEGRAGAIFRPSRMAGDNYSITAYLDIPFALDTTDEKPKGALKEVKVGDFEIWRLINLVEHFKKGSQTTGTMPSLAEYYADAFIEIKDDRGSVKDLTQAQYDAMFTAGFALAGGNALIRKYGLAPGSQWDAPVPATPPPARTPTTWIATFLPYNAFKAAVSAGEHKTGAALTALLTSNGVETSAKYNTRQNTLAKSTGDEMCRAKSTKDGITVLQFVGTTNLEGTLGSTLNGRAVSQNGAANRSKGGFLLCQTDAGTEQTPAHEIGHLLFLPHAPSLDHHGNKRTDDIGQVPDFHDGANWNCVMSYTRPRPGFCGLCLIRLRGWKGDQFDKNGPKTTK